MRIGTAISRLSLQAVLYRLRGAGHIQTVRFGRQVNQNWPGVVYVSCSNMKRNSRADDEHQKPAASKKVPNPPEIDYREHPELYKVARGEQGVLTVEPYKSEILPHWRFR